MQVQETILERWFAHLMEEYPGQTIGMLPDDKFRNPVGYTLRENLAIVVHELLSSMDLSAVRAALESIVRIRVVQDLTPDQPSAFVAVLKPILTASLPREEAAALDSRVDQLAVIASEEHARCRQRLSDIRVREQRRASGGAVALAQARRAL